MPSVSEAAPAQSLDQVKSEIQTLDAQSEAATQQYDGAQQQYAQLQQQINDLQGQIATESANLRTLQKGMGLQAGAQYQQGNVSPALQLAMTATPDAFLTQASVANETGSEDAARLKQITAAQLVLKQDQAAAAALLAQKQTAVNQLAANKATIQNSLNKEQSLLAALTAQQRATVESTTGGGGSSGASTYNGPPPSVSGRAGVAIAYAESKVGKAMYEVGATGPNYYDCSGLVYAAWRSAGVSLERDSMEQWASLPHISESELEPGDLVFYYPGSSGPGHVAMYIGGGKIVQALHQGAPVMVSPMLGQMPLVGFARVV
ncbi:MAG TPA: NlpC/P60 family protein [Actinocrinis sp.]|nr:NlpC/P60 family protein [Actinocrinis sp.]